MDFFSKRMEFRFIIDETDITDGLEKILQSDKIKGAIITSKKEKVLKFLKSNDKIELELENEKFSIDKEPIKFFNENNQIIFKIYDLLIQDFSNILDMTSIYYDFYLLSYEKISLKDLIKKIRKIKTIILKSKFDQYREIFEPLCTELAKTGDIIDIKANCFLPQSSDSLLVNHNSSFKLFIDQRIDLINKLIEFIQSTKYILKIYGSYGIGKSITFLYLTTIKNDYKFIYFNLKDIYKYRGNKYLCFKNTLMKYYSNYSKSIMDKNKKNKKNYFLYIGAIKYLEDEFGEKFSKGDFWTMLKYFCEYISMVRGSVIIIDQYKSEYGSTETLNNILTTYKDKGTIKFIIASSLNDYLVKEDFIMDLMIIYKDIIPFKNTLEKIENIKEPWEEEMENNIFKNFTHHEISEDKSLTNDDFSRISKFNEEIIIKNEIKKEELNEIFYKYKIKDEEQIQPNDIIYINNLISVKSIIKKMIMMKYIDYSIIIQKLILNIDYPIL